MPYGKLMLVKCCFVITINHKIFNPDIFAGIIILKVLPSFIVSAMNNFMFLMYVHNQKSINKQMNHCSVNFFLNIK